MSDEIEGGPEGLSHAGAIIDKAIEYMEGQGIVPVSIASALLAGALGLLARTVPDNTICQILENALASVRRGDLHQHRAPDA